MGVTKRRGLWASLLAALLLAAPIAPALAQGGGGGGGGTPDVVDLYSDLVIALRDVNGLPILAEYETTDETGVITERCVQPVSADLLPGMTVDDAVTNPVDGRDVYLIPLMGALDLPAEEEAEIEVCDPQPAYAMYVSEAELERLNMARTDQDVIDQKLADVMERLLVADEVTLDGAGRLTIDGLVVDASPEHAALFQSLMKTGTIPGLGVDPAVVDIFDAWDLAAASLGSAASKGVPISIDAVLYYVRITDTATSDGWRAPPLVSPNGEKFVDFSAFSYTRADVFPGCATWLDVPSLTWMTSPITELAAFADLPPIAVGGTVGNVAGFAQLADDVRAVINVLHENEVIAGFFMDPVGQNTCDAQAAALVQPAVSWAGVPAEIIQTETFPVSASAYNPHGGTLIPDALVRVTIDAADPDVDFSADDVGRITAIEQISQQPVPFALDPATGNLVGDWGPAEGFPMEPGYQVTTTFDVKVDDGAPVGTYQLTLELIDVSEATVLATDVATMAVLPAYLTALWTSVPSYVLQATNANLTARVFNPVTAAATDGAELKLTLDAPDPFLATSEVTVYSNAVLVPMTLDVDGNLSGVVPLASLDPGASTSVTWYAMVADGAPLGPYFVTVEAVASLATPDVAEMFVAPAETHGGGGGEEPVPEDPTSLNDLFATTTFAVGGTYIPLVGDFDGTSTAGVQDIFWYAPGTAADSIWTMTGTPGALTYTSHPVSVGGTYQPFVHDFDGNGVDDIFWYAPGAAADYVWFGLGDLAFQSKPISVGGTYQPVPTFAGGKPVVYWYAPGSAKDYLSVANTDRTFTSITPKQVTGASYEPVPIKGASGQPGILWYAPGTAQDWVWDGLPLSSADPATNVRVTIDGDFTARPAYPAALLYSETGSDYLFGFELYGDGWTPLPGDLSGAAIVGSSFQMGMIVLHAPGSAPDQVLSLIP